MIPVKAQAPSSSRRGLFLFETQVMFSSGYIRIASYFSNPVPRQKLQEFAEAVTIE